MACAIRLASFGDRRLHSFCKNEKAQFQAFEFAVGDCTSIRKIFSIFVIKVQDVRGFSQKMLDPQPPWTVLSLSP
jgi:hypothetical protein